MDKDFIPKNLDDFKIHLSIIKRLKLHCDDKIPNMLFYGMNNSGKKTIINAFLNFIFKTDVTKQTRLCKTELKISNNTVKIEYLSSPYHFEINLYEFGFYDKHIITDFIQGILSSNINFNQLKIIVINHFDKISKLAQLALRRIIEKTYKVGRFIIICENYSSIDNAIQSRFTSYRIPKPKQVELVEYVKSVLDKYSIKYNNTNDIINFINDSKNDLFSINLQLEHIIDKNNFNNRILFGNNNYIAEIIPYIEKDNLNSMKLLREKIYKLLLINIEPPELLKLIYEYYINSNQLCDDKKVNLSTIAAKCDNYIVNVEYNIIVLEFFILNIKKLLINT